MLDEKVRLEGIRKYKWLVVKFAFFLIALIIAKKNFVFANYLCREIDNTQHRLIISTLICIGLQFIICNIGFFVFDWWEKHEK